MHEIPATQAAMAKTSFNDPFSRFIKKARITEKMVRIAPRVAIAFPGEMMLKL